MIANIGNSDIFLTNMVIQNSTYKRLGKVENPKTKHNPIRMNDWERKPDQLESQYGGKLFIYLTLHCTRCTFSGGVRSPQLLKVHTIHS